MTDQSELVPVWFVNLIIVAALVSGSFLQANGLKAILVVLIVLALLGAALNYWKPAR